MTTEQPNDRRKRFRVKADNPPQGEKAKPRVKAGSSSASALSAAATPQEKQAPAKKAAAKKTTAKKSAAKKK